MPEKLIPYDPAEALTSNDAVDEFMRDAFESGDAGYIAHALGVVTRSKGMTGMAKETVLAMMQSLGFELTVKRHNT